jgi:hypothetical protein
MTIAAQTRHCEEPAIGDEAIPYYAAGDCFAPKEGATNDTDLVTASERCLRAKQSPFEQREIASGQTTALAMTRVVSFQLEWRDSPWVSSQ